MTNSRRQILDGATAALAATSLGGCTIFGRMLEEEPLPKPLRTDGSAPDSLNGIARARGLRLSNALGAGPSGTPAGDFAARDNLATAHFAAVRWAAQAALPS